MELFRRIEKYQLQLLEIERKVDDCYRKEADRNKEYVEEVAERSRSEVQQVKKLLVGLKCEGQERIENRLREIRKENTQIFKRIHSKIPTLDNPEQSLTAQIVTDDGKIHDELVHGH